MGLTEHHISRREIIKKGAVAGAVFWSAPVIESVVSRAAAQSNQCTSTATFNASYIFVVFQVGSTIYFSGFAQGGGCDSQGAVQGGPVCVPCGTVSYTLNDFSGSGSAQGSLTYGSSCSSLQTPATYATASICAQYLTISGGTVSAVPGSGATIVAAFCFGGSTLSGACATTESSSGCAYANCG